MNKSASWNPGEISGLAACAVYWNRCLRVQHHRLKPASRPCSAGSWPTMPHWPAAGLPSYAIGVHRMNQCLLATSIPCDQHRLVDLDVPRERHPLQTLFRRQTRLSSRLRCDCGRIEMRLASGDAARCVFASHQRLTGTRPVKGARRRASEGWQPEATFTPVNPAWRLVAASYRRINAHQVHISMPHEITACALDAHPALLSTDACSEGSLPCSHRGTRKGVAVVTRPCRSDP